MCVEMSDRRWYEAMKSILMDQRESKKSLGLYVSGPRVKKMSSVEPRISHYGADDAKRIDLNIVP